MEGILLGVQSVAVSLATGGDFEEEDRLRTEIAAAGWVVRDVAEGFQLVPK